MGFDYHVHTIWSDGTLSPEELILECRKKGILDVGITDHYGTTKYSDEFQVTDVKAYVDKMEQLREENRDMTIHIGLEVDFSGKYGREISDMNFDEMNQVEYLLFEHVDTKLVEGNPVDGRPLEDLLRIRDRLHGMVGFAHNNFQQNFEGRTDKVIRAMKENEIFLELCEAEDKGKKAVDARIFAQMKEIKKNFNSAFEIQELIKQMKENKNQGLANKKHCIDGKYYFELFTEDTWNQIVQNQLMLSISSDSHKGLEIGKNERVLPYIIKYGLEKQLIFHS